MTAQRVGLFLLIIGSAAAGEVKAYPGEKITLECKSPTDAAVTNLVWTRTDLEDDYVFFLRHNRTNENYQDPRFRTRVELKDPQMKNGDVSVILKDVSVGDAGTYQCQVITSMNRRKRDVGELGTLVNSIHLSVSEGPEQPGGPTGRVGMGVSFGLVCLLVVVVGAGLVVKSKRAKEKRTLESVDEKVNVKLNP